MAQNDTINNQLDQVSRGAILEALVTLRIAVAVVLSLGEIIGIRRAIAERTALLAAEQERSRRLIELTVFKAYFTALIAHELANPLAATYGYSEMMRPCELTLKDQAYALEAIRTEAATLVVLVNDIRNAATKVLGLLQVTWCAFLRSLVVAEIKWAGKVPGADLGLYLSRRIVRAHGAELMAESTPGIGSVFAFELGAAR